MPVAKSVRIARGEHMTPAKPVPPHSDSQPRAQRAARKLVAVIDERIRKSRVQV
jgi:hypothetical protein